MGRQRGWGAGHSTGGKAARTHQGAAEASDGAVRIQLEYGCMD